MIVESVLFFLLQTTFWEEFSQNFKFSANCCNDEDKPARWPRKRDQRPSEENLYGSLDKLSLSIGERSILCWYGTRAKFLNKQFLRSVYWSYLHIARGDKHTNLQSLTQNYWEFPGLLGFLNIMCFAFKRKQFLVFFSVPIWRNY